MKSRWFLLLGSGLAGLLLTGCSVGQIGTPAAPKGPYQVVDVVASNWKWTLSDRHLKYGEPIKFLVKSVQGVHGFSIMGTNVSNAVSAGQPPETVIWNPPAKGVYTIACNIYCGAGHDQMVTTFTVS